MQPDTQQTRPLRAFFAIELPEAEQNKINDVIHSLQKEYPHESIRWTKSHNLHITLQFLASIQPQDLPKLISHVGKELTSCSPFDLQLKALELFPTPDQPRIISINVEPQDVLSALSQQIGRGVTATGYDIEKRLYRGHLTLARLSHTTKHFSLAKITLPDLEPIPVREIILFRSEPTSKGSQYTHLERFPLLPH